MRKKIWERIVPISKAGRKLDIEFWQLQNPNRRFRIAFDMPGDYYRSKGKKINACTLRLQRDEELIKPKQNSKRPLDSADTESSKSRLKIKNCLLIDREINLPKVQKFAEQVFGKGGERRKGVMGYSQIYKN